MKVIEFLEKANKTLFSYEIIPPLRGGSIEKIFNLVEKLKPLDPPFIDLTSRSAEVFFEESNGNRFKKYIRKKRPGTIGISAAIKNKFNIETVPHILCHGFTKEETEDALIELNYLGIDNILAVRGDELRIDKSASNNPNVNQYASDLVAQISKMNKGIYLENLIDSSRSNFCIGVGGYPEKHFESSSLDRDIINLKKKVDLGADYIVTQMFFDNKVYFKFLEKCKQAGITVPIIPGIKILSSEAHLTKLPKYFFLDIPNELSNQVIGRDKNEIRQAGVKWAQNQVHELLEFGVPCVHFYIMSSTKSVVEVLSEF